MYKNIHNLEKNKNWVREKGYSKDKTENVLTSMAILCSLSLRVYIFILYKWQSTVFGYIQNLDLTTNTECQNQSTQNKYVQIK